MVGYKVSGLGLETQGLAVRSLGFRAHGLRPLESKVCESWALGTSWLLKAYPKEPRSHIVYAFALI